MLDFIKSKQNSLMGFDPTNTDIDLSKFPREYWSETSYG